MWLAIAALYRCLVRHLDRDPTINRDLDSVSRAITSENMWRAQRWGVRAKFIDGAGGLIPFADHLELILNDIAEDADALGCTPEVASARELLTRGTSAERQVAIFDDVRAAGGSTTEALIAITDWMAGVTVDGRLS